MLTKEEFEEIKPKLIATLTEAIYQSALKHPEGFKAWLSALSEGPQDD